LSTDTTRRWRRRAIVEGRIPHSPEQDGVRRSGFSERLGRQRIVPGAQRGAADQPCVARQLVPVPARHAIEYRPGGLDDLGANAVARQQQDPGVHTPNP
jgi:hypothetical protein